MLPFPPRVAVRASLLLCLALSGCGETGAEPAPEADVIPRETFVETYVGLRRAAVLQPGELPDSAREAVLARHGVTADDLLRFAEVRGTDIAFMRDVWAEVEERLARERLPLDSVPGAGGDPGGVRRSRVGPERGWGPTPTRWWREAWS